MIRPSVQPGTVIEIEFAEVAQDSALGIGVHTRDVALCAGDMYGSTFVYWPAETETAEVKFIGALTASVELRAISRRPEGDARWIEAGRMTVVDRRDGFVLHCRKDQRVSSPVELVARVRFRRRKRTARKDRRRPVPAAPVRVPQTAPDVESDVVRMTSEVYEEIRASIGSRPAESGGVLGGSRADGVVTDFYFDATSAATGGSYTPDHDAINLMMRESWDHAGTEFLGAIHSHPPGVRGLSFGDDVYAARILDAMPDLERLVAILVMSGHDGRRFELLPYVVRRGNPGEIIVEPAELEVLGSAAQPRSSDPFARISGDIDVAGLGDCRVVAVGTGGAGGWLEDMARCGVGQFVLIDGDVVTPSNLATQRVYRSDLGRAKVNCVAERIAEINPRASTHAVPSMLDELNDKKMARLVQGRLGPKIPKPTVTVICGFTDAFEAQARVNRLALHLGVPSLCAQLYAEGRGAELSFTYPGVTPACHRCALASRYEAYLDAGYRNGVGSNGAPIFATERLNAIKGFVGLAILHRGLVAGGARSGGAGERWAALLERIGDRNLALIRLDPDVGTSLGMPQFDTVLAGAQPESVIFDETIWRPQLPDSPKNGYPRCPDCGGTGDLRRARGRFRDTRLMLPTTRAA